MLKIDKKLMRKVLLDTNAVNAAVPKRTIGSIKMEVCGTFGVTPEDLSGPSKRKTITLARKIFAARAHTEAKASLWEIGQELGGRDHTVIMYYLRSFPLGAPDKPGTTETTKGDTE